MSVKEKLDALYDAAVKLLERLDSLHHCSEREEYRALEAKLQEIEYEIRHIERYSK